MLETPVSHTTITRTQLYELVWTTPIQKLATRFGLSDVGLAKVCKRHKIPRPPRGYWAKLANGKRVRKFPLSEVKDPSLEEVHFADRGTAAVASPRAEKQLAVDPAIADLIAAESLPDHRIEVATDLRGADPLVQATREALQQAEPDDYGRVSRRWDFPKPCFEVCVGRASAQRALLILHSLVRAFKVRGYKLVEKSDSSGWAGCEVLGRQFQISIWEPSKRQKRELTKAEIEERKRYQWLFRRDYEHVPAGSLEVHLNRGTYTSTGRVSDTSREPLEDRLNDVIVCILRAIDRAQVEAAEQKIKEAEQARKKAIAVEQEVVRRTSSVRQQRLLDAIPKWEDFVRIRRYVEAIRAEAIRRHGSVAPASESGRWLRWADEYLRSIDPLSEERTLPTYSLTESELDILRKECSEDWSPWSESFRPRQPR